MVKLIISSRIGSFEERGSALPVFTGWVYCGFPRTPYPYNGGIHLLYCRVSGPWWGRIRSTEGPHTATGWPPLVYRLYDQSFDLELEKSCSAEEISSCITVFFGTQ
ncbi:hypothetical protein FKM82_013190 [Ascaphus truei]